MFWADVILLVAGLFVIALAMILSQRLGNSPVQLGFEKLGLDLKADRMTFVLVVGLLLIAVGVFFRYRDYESELEKLNSQVSEFKPMQDAHNKNLELLTNELQKFKVYDLRLKIEFPEEVSGDSVEQFFNIEIWTKKLGAPTFEKSSYRPATAFDETYVNLSNLDQGERIKIIGLDKRDNSQWLSESEIEIPETQIQMKKVKPLQ